MSGPHDINPKISQDPDKIWAVANKRLPGRGLKRDEFLFRPPYVYSGGNVRIAYPGFLTWLKFVDPDRKGEDLDKKVSAYDLAKSQYEQRMLELLKQLREGKAGKKLDSSMIIMAEIDKADGHLVTIRPSPWDQVRDNPGPSHQVDDSGLAAGYLSPGFLRPGTGSTIRISPEALNDPPEASFFVADEILLHELTHAVFASDGASKAKPLDPPWGEDQEFFAVQVENVYRSEKGLKKIRGSHDDPPVWWNDTENLLDHTEFSPPVRILLGRFKGFIPGVFDKLANIPQAKATYNPFRKYKEEEQAKATPPSP